MEKFITATGKTIDLAIEAGLTQLSMDRDSVSVEILETPKSGFFRHWRVAREGQADLRSARRARRARARPVERVEKQAQKVRERKARGGRKRPEGHRARSRAHAAPDRAARKCQAHGRKA